MRRSSKPHQSRLSYVIYPGERFYDGQLVAIEDQRLVFRHETVFYRRQDVSSRLKRKLFEQQAPVDAMTAAKAAPAADAGATEKKPEEKSSTSEKP